MNKEYKDKWVVALRSGQYKQSQKALRDEYGFCCLGVVCDIIDPTGWIGYDYVDKVNAEVVHQVGLTQGIRKLIGLDVRILRALTEMNDNQDYTFNMIADYIEETL